MSKTVNYNKPLPKYGHLFKKEDWMDCVESGAFIDYDGFGHPVKDGLMDGNFDIYPSIARTLPDDATHVMWFNR